jgi:molybdate transport system ATP-binding protein
MLSVDIERRIGAFRLAATFQAGEGVTALFGRSGSGKTSTVDAIAGLLRPDRGRIEINGETLFDAARGIDVPTPRRRVGYVFQEGRLFPHLSVRQNLNYAGLFSRGMPASGFDRMVELLGLRDLLDRRPGNLSGGEKQRVAIGRALLSSPRLLLLDEPLASLDAGHKGEILPYLVRLRDEGGIPMVYVSHIAAEVRQIATDVVRLEEGRVTAAGGLELLAGTS